MQHIGADFLGLHRLEMMRRDHPLAQLFQPRRILQQVAKLRLAQQQDLQQRMRAQLEVGEHTQLFERLDREVLGLVHHQQTAATGARFLVQERLDQRERARLVVPPGRQAEGACGHVDQLVAIKPAGHDLCRGQSLAVDRCQQMRRQCRFARTHRAGDDDEALALRKAIAKIRQRLAVRSALEIEFRIGGELEGPPGELVERIVHRGGKPFFRSCSAARPARSRSARRPRPCG